MCLFNHQVILSLAIICLASINIQALSINSSIISGYELTFTKNNPKYFLLEHRSYQVFGDNDFAYAYCDVGPRDIADGRNCDVVLARFDNKGLVSNKSCNIHFPYKNGKGLQLLYVHSSHDDRVVFSYPKMEEPEEEKHEEYKTTMIVNVNLTLEVVDMNTCKLYQTEVETKSLAGRATNHIRLDIFHHDNNTFDVLVPYARCTGGRCKYTFNDKAEQISGPVPVLPMKYKNHPMKVYPFESTNAYFAFVIDMPRLPENLKDIPSTSIATQELLYVKDDIVTKLTNFSVDIFTKLPFEYLKGHVREHYSSDLFGFCRQYTVDDKQLVNCMQFDENNKQRINVTIGIEENREVLAVYNAPTGLLFIEATRDGEFCEGFSIRKIALDNSVIVDQLEMNATIPVLYATVKSDGDLFCISMYAGKPRNYDIDVTFTKKCLPASITHLYTLKENQ